MNTTVFPTVESLRVMLIWEHFDRSEEGADEMDLDHDAMDHAATMIRRECSEVFPNAEVQISADNSSYAQWFTAITGWSEDDDTTPNYEAEETLLAIVDDYTIYGKA